MNMFFHEARQLLNFSGYLMQSDFTFIPTGAVYRLFTSQLFWSSLECKLRKHFPCRGEFDIDRYVPAGVLRSQAAPKITFKICYLPSQLCCNIWKKTKQAPPEDCGKHEAVVAAVFCWFGRFNGMEVGLH